MRYWLRGNSIDADGPVGTCRQDSKWFSDHKCFISKPVNENDLIFYEKVILTMWVGTFVSKLSLDAFVGWEYINKVSTPSPKCLYIAENPVINSHFERPSNLVFGS